MLFRLLDRLEQLQFPAVHGIQPGVMTIGDGDSHDLRLANAPQRTQVRAIGDDGDVPDRLRQSRVLEESSPVAGEDGGRRRAIYFDLIGEVGDCVEIGT